MADAGPQESSSSASLSPLLAAADSICLADKSVISIALPYFDSFSVPSRWLVGMTAHSIIEHVQSFGVASDPEAAPNVASADSAAIIAASLDVRMHSLECVERLKRDVSTVLQGAFAALIVKCWVYLVWAWTLQSEGCAASTTGDDRVQMLWSIMRITFDPLRRTKVEFKARENRNVKSDIKKGMRLCAMLLNDQLLFRRLAISGAIANNTLLSLPTAMLNPGYLHHLLSTSHGTLSQSTVMRQFSWLARCSPSQPQQQQQQQQQFPPGQQQLSIEGVPAQMEMVTTASARPEKRKASALTDEKSEAADMERGSQAVIIKGPPRCQALKSVEADIVFSFEGRCERVTSRYSRMLRMEPAVGRQLRGKDFSAPWAAFTLFRGMQEEQRARMKRVILANGRLSPKLRQRGSTLRLLVSMMQGQLDVALLTTITVRVGSNTNVGAEEESSAGTSNDRVAVLYGLWWHSGEKLLQHVLACVLTDSIPATLGEHDEIVLEDDGEE
jgi:hypothetical protein